MNNRITLFQGGRHLSSTNLQPNWLINLRTINKCCLALFMLFFMGNIGFAISDYPLATDNNNTEFSCDGKANDIWLTGSNGKEVRISNGQQLCRADIGFTHGFVRVRTSGQVGSMQIWVKGAVNIDNLENHAPYDSKSFDFKNGSYTVRAKIFSKSARGGTTCSEKTFNFTIKDCGNNNTAPACDGKANDIWLTGSNGKEVRINNGQELCRADIGFTHGFVRVRTSGHVGSMQIWIKGAVNVDNLENSAPYDSKSFDFKNGSYTVRAKIFSKSQGGGETCSERTFNFTIKDCNTGPCTSRVWFKNTGCQNMEIFKIENGREQHAGNAGPNGQKDVNTFKGQKFTIKVNGKVIKNWTVSGCNDSTQNIDTKGCTTAPACDGKANDIWLTGSNGKEVRINNGQQLCRADIGFTHGFVRVRTSGHVGSMQIWVKGAVNVDNLENSAPYDSKSFDLKNGSYSVRTKIFSKSAGGGTTCSERTFNFTIKDCGNNNTVCKSRVWFKNTGCQTLEIFKHQDGREQHVGRANPNGQIDVYTFKGQRFTIKIGNKVFKTWTVSGCDESTQNLDSKGCERNDAPDCGTIKISTTQGKIKIAGLKGAPVSHVQIMNKRSWKQVFNCAGNCKGTENISVPTGDYWIKVTYFTKQWQYICEVQKDVHVQGHLTNNINTINRAAISTGSNLATGKLEKTQESNTSNSTEILPTFGDISTTLPSIKVYPNPASTTLAINTHNLVGQDGQLTLINQFGHIVKQVSLNTLTEAQLNLNISNYQAGVYLVNIQLANGERITNRVLIQK